MPIVVFELSMGFPRHRGGENYETFKRVPSHHRVQVGARMTVKPAIEEPDDWASPFPATVKQVRVVYVGGPMDGVCEDIAVDDFFDEAAVQRHDLQNPSLRGFYEPHGDLQHIDGGLWTGYWVLTNTMDTRKPWASNTTWHKLPPGLALPTLPLPDNADRDDVT